MGDGLQGKRVTVTAGASGIGRVTANAFLTAGSRVHVCDIDEKALQAFRAEQPTADTMLADVADPAQVDRLFYTVAVRDTALKTFVSPQDVADMILYLCSDAGRRISGQAIPVDAFTHSAGA